MIHLKSFPRMDLLKYVTRLKMYQLIHNRTALLMFPDLISPFTIEIAFNFGPNKETNLCVDKGQIYGES